MAALSEVASLVQRYCSSAASVAEQSGARQALSERMQAPGKLSLLDIVSALPRERALDAPARY